MKKSAVKVFVYRSAEKGQFSISIFINVVNSLNLIGKYFTELKLFQVSGIVVKTKRVSKSSLLTYPQD